MEKRQLGQTGLWVSSLCFGSLPLGPLQKDMSPQEGGGVILAALKKGINFIDTAQLYGTYPHIRWALERWPGEVVVATKSYDYSGKGMAKSLEEARRELNRDTIDVFLLHEQESRLTLKGHGEALEYLVTAKEQGILKAIGVSTHTVEVTKAAGEMPEIDVIHPIINFRGLGIIDGNRETMEKALASAYEAGKGIYTMKPLGGGNLVNHVEEALDYILGLPWVHSTALGMQTVAEVDYNAARFCHQTIPAEVGGALSRQIRSLHVAEWCEGCGKCIQRCSQGALGLSEGVVEIDGTRCVLCGYCGAYCPQFCLKIY